MSDTFDITRANDRSYIPPAPWTLWCFASNSWTCIECQAGAWMSVHRDDCRTTDACRKKFHTLVANGVKTVTLARAATPAGTLSSAAIAPIADVVNLEFPMPPVRCQNCPRGPAPTGPDGTWTCATCGAKAGPWRMSKQAPNIHITNHFGSERIMSALTSEEGQRLIRNSIARAVPRYHALFDARCTVDSEANASVAPIPVVSPDVARYAGPRMPWPFVAIALVAIGALIVWLL